MVTCPLCVSTNYESRGTASLGEVVREIESRLKIAVPTSVPRHRLSLELYRCLTCGLDFFHPSVTGDAAFYSAIGDAAYTGLRWDHRRALAGIKAGDLVVDVGGGNGTFLRGLEAVGAEGVAVDFSQSNEIRTTVHNQLTVDFREPGWSQQIRELLGKSPNVVTAFQVLEHVVDPLEFTDGLVRLAGNDGRIVLSVPNRDRFEVSDFQALDFPPHHLTRWSTEQLAFLGMRLGLTIEEMKIQRNLNPFKILLGAPYSELTRRRSQRTSHLYAGRPWPLRKVVNGQNLLVSFRKT